MGVASLVMGLENWLYIKNERVELKWNNFRHAGTNPGKLQVDSMVFGKVWSKMAMVF